MARGSQPSSPNSRFKVWNLAGDLYSHTELAENWDTLDAIIGRPASGTDWPPMGERGINGGLYKYITLLQRERMPIGGVMFWWRPNATVPIPTGFEEMKGQVISAANHNFPGIATDIRLPEGRNVFFIGADSTKSVGQAGTANNSPSGAPGVTIHNGSGNVGSGGSNFTNHAHVVPAHAHAVGAHQHTVDNHSHNFDHRHNLLGDIGSEGGTPSYIATVYELEPSAIRNFLEISYPAGVLSPRAADKPETGILTPNISHRHYIGAHAHVPTLPNNLGVPNAESGGAAPATSYAGGGSTGAQGETSVNNAELDNRPNHIGLIPLMKVRSATSV